MCMCEREKERECVRENMCVCEKEREYSELKVFTPF